MCEHSVVKNGWDHIDPEITGIPIPRTAEELPKEKQKRDKQKPKPHSGIEFLDDYIR